MVEDDGGFEGTWEAFEDLEVSKDVRAYVGNIPLDRPLKKEVRNPSSKKPNHKLNYSVPIIPSKIRRKLSPLQELAQYEAGKLKVGEEFLRTHPWAHQTLKELQEECPHLASADLVGMIGVLKDADLTKAVAHRKEYNANPELRRRHACIREDDLEIIEPTEKQQIGRNGYKANELVRYV